MRRLMTLLPTGPARFARGHPDGTGSCHSLGRQQRVPEGAKLRSAQQFGCCPWAAHAGGPAIHAEFADRVGRAEEDLKGAVVPFYCCYPFAIWLAYNSVRLDDS